MSPHASALAIAVRVEKIPYRPRFWGTRRADPAWAVGFLLVTAVLQVLDAGSTWLGLQVGGTEANPLMAWVLSTPGPALFFFVKALVVLALVGWAVTIAWQHRASRGMLRGIEALAVGLAAVVVANVLIVSNHVYGLGL